MKGIKTHICSSFQLSEEEAHIFLAQFSRTVLRKNEVFIEKGKVCNTIGLIEKGLMICVYTKEGDEIIDEFAFENSFVTNYYSFLTNTPSEKEIRCVEDTTVYVINRQSLEKLGQEYPFIERMARIVNEKLFLRSHERVKSLLLDSAPERYQKLLLQRQDLAQRIPQYLIASYLKVKPETISRIRKKYISEGLY